MICAAAIAVCGTGRAQSFVDRIKVHFSTPVTVDDTVVPAGDCTIKVIRGSSDKVVLEVRSDSGAGTAVLVQVSRLSDSNAVTNEHVNLILSHRDNGYRLEQIVFPDHTGFQVLD